MLVGFTHVKEKKRILSLRGSIPSEHVKDIDKEARAPDSTEDMMEQESLKKNWMEGHEMQPKLLRSNIIKSMMEGMLTRACLPRIPVHACLSRACFPLIPVCACLSPFTFFLFYLNTIVLESSHFNLTTLMLVA